eukprot:5732344-Amphidinium_carterae.2
MTDLDSDQPDLLHWAQSLTMNVSMRSSKRTCSSMHGVIAVLMVLKRHHALVDIVDIASSFQGRPSMWVAT